MEGDMEGFRERGREEEEEGGWGGEKERGVKLKRGEKGKNIITYKRPWIGIVLGFFQQLHQKLEDHGKDPSKFWMRWFLT